MARRTVLTSRQRSALFALPQREADLLARRRPRNKRVRSAGLSWIFIGRQLDLDGNELADYADAAGRRGTPDRSPHRPSGVLAP